MTANLFGSSRLYDACVVCYRLAEIYKILRILSLSNKTYELTRFDHRWCGIFRVDP